MSEYRSLGSGSDDFDALLTFFRGQYKANVNAGTPMSTRLWEEFKEDASLASSFIAGATADHLERSNMAKENTWFDDTMAVMENIPAVGKLAAATGLSAAMLMKISTKAGGIGRGYFKQGGMVKGGMSTPKKAWQQTKLEYEAPVSLKPAQQYKINVGDRKVRVAQNPDDVELRALRDEAKQQYSNPPPDTIFLRSTQDEAGNKYYWDAQEAMHSYIEPDLGRLTGAKLDQNAEKISHRRVVREALYNGENVPDNVLSDYPGLLEEVRGIKGNQVSMSTPKGFTVDTTIPNFEDALRKPNYFRDEKNISVRRVMMPPDDYIKQASEGFGKSIEYVTSQRDPKLIKQYADDMLKGDKFPAASLDYDKYGFSQEGLHRALAAKQAGISEIPVSIRTAHRHEFPPKPTEQEVTSRYVNDLLDEELAERSLDEWMSSTPVTNKENVLDDILSDFGSEATLGEDM